MTHFKSYYGVTFGKIYMSGISTTFFFHTWVKNPYCSLDFAVEKCLSLGRGLYIPCSFFNQCGLPASVFKLILVSFLFSGGSLFAGNRKQRVEGGKKKFYVSIRCSFFSICVDRGCEWLSKVPRHKLKNITLPNASRVSNLSLKNTAHAIKKVHL